jgi:hypothetical protein
MVGISDKLATLEAKDFNKTTRVLTLVKPSDLHWQTRHQAPHDK